MPVSKSIGSIYSFNTNYKTSSISIASLVTTNVFINATTAMFSERIEASHGTVCANYIFIDDQCEVELKNNVKLKGKVYLVDTDTYNNIWWTWSDQGMIDYIDKHNIQGVTYNDEPFKVHYSELVQLHDINSDIL